MSKFASKFFRYKDKWMYKEIGQEKPKDVDTHALENILGVIGGPLVFVVREQTPSSTGQKVKEPNYEPPKPVILRVEIRNGFITRASKADSHETLLCSGVEVDEFCVRPLRD